MKSTPSPQRALIFAAVLLLAAIVGTQAQAAEATTEDQGQTSSEEAAAFDLVLDMRIITQYPQDTSFQVISDESVYNSLQLAAGLTFDNVFPGLRAYFLFETSLHQAPSRLNGEYIPRWDQNYFMLAVEWGPTLFDFFRPFARIGAGYALQSLSFGPSDEQELHDFAHDLAYTGSLGFETFLKLGKIGASDFYGALSTQIGYRGQTVAQFDELAVDEDSNFAVEAVNMGDLHTDGIFWDIGFGIRMAF